MGESGMIAQPSDLDHIAQLLIEAHGKYQQIPYDEERGRSFIRRSIIDPDAYVATSEHGVIIGCVHPAWWFNGLIATDVVFYARKGGLSLLRGFLAWARGWTAVKQIQLGVSSGDERAQRLYTRLGLRPAGGLFVEVRA